MDSAKPLMSRRQLLRKRIHEQHEKGLKRQVISKEIMPKEEKKQEIEEKSKTKVERKK